MMTQVERTTSWLGKAFSSSEHLSIIFKVSCQFIVCHIWIIQSCQKKKMPWKVALNEQFAELIPVLWAVVLHSCRTCCHLVDSNPPKASGPWTQHIPLDGAGRNNPEFTLFQVSSSSDFQISQSYKPRITVKFKRIFPQLLPVSSEIPGYRFPSTTLKTDTSTSILFTQVLTSLTHRYLLHSFHWYLSGFKDLAQATFCWCK